ASLGTADYLRELAAPRNPDRLHFAQIVLDRQRPRGQATCRRSRGLELLQRDSGRLATEHMMALLRDHYDGTPWAAWDPAELDVKSICMHSTPYHRVKTAGSMVAHLDGEPGRSLLWLAVGQPCRRIFLPYRMAELTSQEELDATLRVEALLEQLFGGAAGEKSEGNKEAEHRLLQAVRAMEK